MAWSQGEQRGQADAGPENTESHVRNEADLGVEYKTLLRTINTSLLGDFGELNIALSARAAASSSFRFLTDVSDDVEVRSWRMARQSRSGGVAFA